MRSDNASLLAAGPFQRRGWQLEGRVEQDEYTANPMLCLSSRTGWRRWQPHFSPSTSEVARFCPPHTNLARRDPWEIGERVALG